MENNNYKIGAPSDTRKRFAMIRSFTLADYLTFGNIVCGLQAIYLSMQYMVQGQPEQLYYSALFLIFALIFDILDGPVARKLQSQSVFGMEIDTLADCISFGVAPTIFAYSAGFNANMDNMILSVFLVFCVCRLARFNATSEQYSFGGDKVTLILGIPTAWSLLPTLLICGALYYGVLENLQESWTVSLYDLTLHVPVLLYLILGLAMISDSLRFRRPLSD